MKNTPLISVIMPAFNVEEFITQSISSVLNQDFEDFELLVIDDGSTDTTKAIVEQFADNDDRVRLLRNVRSRGASGGRNTGIMEAKGEWLAFLDSDDVWYPDNLLNRVYALDEHPECEVFTSNYNIWFPEESDLEVSICEDNEVWHEYFSKSNEDKTLLVMHRPVEAFIRTALTHTSVVMVKSELVRRLDGFDESLDTYEDVLLWLKLSAYAKCMVYIPFVGSKYRQRQGSLTHSGGPQTKDAPTVFRKLLHDSSFRSYRRLLKENIASHLIINTYWYRENGRKLKAVRYAVESVFAGPFNVIAWKNLVACLLFR